MFVLGIVERGERERVYLFDHEEANYSPRGSHIGIGASESMGIGTQTGGEKATGSSGTKSRDCTKGRC